MYVEIGKRAIHQPKPPELQRSKQPRKPVAQATPIELPVMTIHSVPFKYQCDSLQTVLRWLEQFGQGECRLISWYQMNFWFEHQTGPKGVEYDLQTKRWYTSPANTLTDFPKRTGQLSSYIQGLWAAHSLKQTTFHSRSSSCVLTFWTRCVPVRLASSDWTNMEQAWMSKASHLPSVKVIRDKL